MKVLITGFQPFGKETMNPSFEAVRLLPDEIMGAQIVKAEIPVVFHKGGEKVQELVRSEKPDIVILVGQAGGRTAMNPERVAINCEDCRPAARTTKATFHRVKRSMRTARTLTSPSCQSKQWSKR